MVIFFILIAVYSGYQLAFRGLIFPKVTIAGINVGGMDRITALKLVENSFSLNPTKIILRVGEKEVEDINKIKVEKDLNWAVEQTFLVGRNGNILTQITEQIKTVFLSRDIAVPISYNQDDLQGYIDQLALEINQEPVWPKLMLINGTYGIEPGKDGLEIKKEQLIGEIVKRWGFSDKQLIDIPLERVSTEQNEEMANRAVAALNKWGEKNLTLTYHNFEDSLEKKEMADLLGLMNDIIDENKFETLLVRIQQEIETEPKNAIFQFEDNVVKEFQPEVMGVEIDIPSFKTKLGEVLLTAETETLEIPVILTSPKIKTGDINNLGIKELIGEGTSKFAHSIAGRVFNINLASSRVNGTLVAPGEEFSFNKAVGDISRATGYQPAYVISGGKTVLGDGGGVCQVSTTVFRAALKAGLPITERKAHAYRVGYYEQDSNPGIDATVYNPTADLKFINNTEHHILIQIEVDTPNMAMRVGIYGANDGRKITMTEPKISRQVAPPATLYVDDPTLAVGQTRQIDWSAWGANVSFDYKVVKGEQTIFEKTFYSNYQPWRAIYLRGTKI